MNNSKLISILVDYGNVRPANSLSINDYIAYIKEQDGVDLSYGQALLALNKAVATGLYAKGWFNVRGKRNMYYWRKM